jgi:O-antigen/teichoic acid export membrane protein
VSEVRPRSGLPAIALATAIAGVAGYAVTWVVFRGVGAAEYATFAVYWSATYLIVGALSGIQQEITRGTQPRLAGDVPAGPVARNFAVVAAAAVLVVVFAFTPIWVTFVFPDAGGFWLVVPLAVGSASYVIVAVVAGTFYGIRLWTPLAWMIVLDGLLRLGAIAALVLIDPHAVSLAWAVALPFPISVVIVWLVIRRRVVGRSGLDVAMRPLVWNVSRTVVAAAATGILVSGFPLVLKLTSPGEDAARLGVVILAVTLVRAPLIVCAMSLQSYLIVAFRPPHPLARRAGIVLAAILGGGAILAALGAWLGPALFTLLFGAEAEVDGGMVALLVASSALVAAMFVTGPALLTRSGHFAYTAGWVAAAIVTILALLVPLSFEGRVVLSLLGGPIVGLLVHLGGLVAMRRRAEVTVDVAS